MWRAIAVAIMAALLGGAAREGPGKKAKLIEFGWDEPSTSFVKEHAAEMERMPFDGVILNAHYKDAQGRDRVLEWDGFGAAEISWQSLIPALDDLKATHFRRFTDNFLRFNTTPGDVDWFDDFSAILHNAGMAARLAKQGRLKGILFDIEQYNYPLFTFAKRKRQDRSYLDYEAQVRKRGEEVMAAFQSEYPGLTLFMTFGYALAGANRSEFATSSYGLLGPFLDGLYGAARGKTVIVDGWEFGYPYREPSQFAAAYQRMHDEGARITVQPESFRKRLSAGFGLWMDLDWRRGGWNVDDPSMNPCTPGRLQAALTAALRRSDRYVWLYSEQPRWWPRDKLPEPYVAAVRAARASCGMANP